MSKLKKTRQDIAIIGTYTFSKSYCTYHPKACVGYRLYFIDEKLELQSQRDKAMYNDYFDLERNPFPSTPQLDFYYAGGGRDSAINAIEFALTENFGIIKILGQVGCGKTMVCRQAYRQLAQNYDILFISDPSLDSTQSILTAVASELNPEWDTNRPKNKIFQQVMQTLIQHANNKKPTILFIEEAQKLTTEQFEELRYLTNLETSQDKLLQIVLFGQPSLDAVLLKSDLKLLSSRITHSIFLKPLSFYDFKSYVYHRFYVAGSKKPETLFSSLQLSIIYALANGSLRYTNQLMEKTLFSCYLHKRKKPSLGDIASAARSMSRVGAQFKYTRTHMVSVFSIGMFIGWLAFTATTPIALPATDQMTSIQSDLHTLIDDASVSDTSLTIAARSSAEENRGHNR